MPAFVTARGADTTLTLACQGTTTDKIRTRKARNQSRSRWHHRQLHEPHSPRFAPSCLRERPDKRRHRSGHRLRRRRRPRKHSRHHRPRDLRLVGDFLLVERIIDRLRAEMQASTADGLRYMAEVWLQLADRYQDADEVWPAMQQQQIQPKTPARKTSLPQLGGFVICS